MYYATGIPGWMRGSSFGGYWRCWRFPYVRETQAQLEERAKAIEQEISYLQNELAELRRMIEELRKGEK